VTVNDHSNTDDRGQDVFGIIATTYGIGKVSVTTARRRRDRLGRLRRRSVNQATAIPVAPRQA